MQIKTFSGSEAFVQQSADTVLQSVEQKTDGNFLLALSGGNTPKPVYAKLGKKIGEMNRPITILQIDERYIDRADTRSNQKMIRETLLANNPLNVDFHAFDTSLPLAQAQREYTKILSPLPAIDLSVLGIGPDGHIASLFPHEKALDEQNEKTAHTQTQRFDVADRLTLTYAPILSSKKILILLSGKDKKAIIDRLLEGDEDFHDLPAAKLLTHRNCTLHFCEI